MLSSEGLFSKCTTHHISFVGSSMLYEYIIHLAKNTDTTGSYAGPINSTCLFYYSQNAYIGMVTLTKDNLTLPYTGYFVYYCMKIEDIFFTLFLEFIATGTTCFWHYRLLTHIHTHTILNFKPGCCFTKLNNISLPSRITKPILVLDDLVIGT